MRHTKDELREINRQAREKIEGLKGKIEDQKRHAAAGVENQYNEILDKIKGLQTEKEKLLVAPMSKEELLRLAKEQFNLQRERSLIDGLIDHLKGCQTGIIRPFDPDKIRYSFPADMGLLLFYFVITEKDIERAVSALEDGITEEEREKKIKEIDKEIAGLENLINRG
jgi:hypothetical protein